MIHTNKQWHNILGRSPNASIINDFFNDAYGSSARANSVLSWWPYGIWGQYDNVETEEQCAFRCYIRTVDSCAFYYWGENHCHLGHFDGTWHYLTGTYDGDTKYHIRKDYGNKETYLLITSYKFLFCL